MPDVLEDWSAVRGCAERIRELFQSELKPGRVEILWEFHNAVIGESFIAEFRAQLDEVNLKKYESMLAVRFFPRNEARASDPWILYVRRDWSAR